MGNLETRKQLAILRKIWGGNSEGYVFMPWIPGSLKTKEERRAKGSWKEVHFKWPQQSKEILAHLNKHEADDLYFCPNLFEQPYRTDECLDPNQRVLYADLDSVNPHTIETDYKPTMAWASSDNSYQAVWLLSQVEIGISDEGNENHRLTAYLGADKGGWDITQLLRVPGRKNWKPGKKGQQGELLWDNGPRYDLSYFDNLPEIAMVSKDVEDLDESLLNTLNRQDIWRRVRLKVSGRCRDYFSMRTEEAARDAAHLLGEGMSGLMWYVERELADAGCSVAEIICLVRTMPFNKFKGRHDELTRLKAEANKAIQEKERREIEARKGTGALEEAAEEGKDRALSLTAFMAVPRPRPSWLVDRIWAKRTVGFIAGAPKSYKSWLALDLALSVSTGTPFLGVYEVIGGPGRVLYVQEEDSDIEVMDRTHKVLWGKPQDVHPWGSMAVDLSSVGSRGSMESRLTWSPARLEPQMWLSVRKGLDLTKDTWTGWLDEECEDQGYALVIIDTLGTSVGGTDTDRSNEVNKALKPLKQLAGKHGCAIAVVHHFSKAGARGDAGMNRGGAKMIGSQALHAWVENALYVGEKEEVRSDLHRVRVERESKRAPDLHFAVDVPDMGTAGMQSDEQGERVGVWGWNPIVDTKPQKTEGDDKGAVTGAALNGDGKERVRKGRAPAGSQLLVKLRSGRAIDEKGALSLEDIIDRFFGEVNAASKANVRKQVRDAQRNNLPIQVTEDGRYWMSKGE